jgi:uncharacterized protein involved in exopolysaccharide biosynthesis/Mrp family chromosome partitioning ATPase
MTENHTAPQPAIALNDILYVLFRRKWLILTISLLGIGAAIGVMVFFPFPYQSESKLFIRYVMDTSTEITPETQMHSPDYGGLNVLNSELELITSRNVARGAAEAVGPERILGKGTKLTNNVELAAAYISKNLVTDLPRNDDVITMRFSHPDPSVVQDVLLQLMIEYKKEHKNLHNADGITVQFLMEQSDLAKQRLDDAERQRHEWMAKAGVLSFDDAKKEFTTLNSKLEQEIIDAQADLAQSRAAIVGLQSRYPQITNVAVNSTNAPVGAAVPPAKLAQYESLCQNLDKMQVDQDKLLTQVTTNNPQAQAAQIGIENARRSKEKMEAEFPALLAMGAEHGGEGAPKESPQERVNDEILKAESLMARIAMLTNALAEVQTNVAMVGNAEASTTGYTAQKEAEEESYKHLLSTVEKARIADVYGNGKVSNIGDVESPTPPVRDVKRIQKIVMSLVLGSIGFSLALAFAIELYFNRTFRQPIDVQNKLPFPFFVSIPKTTNGRSTPRLATNMAKLALPPASPLESNHVVADGINGDGAEEAGKVIATAGDMGKLEPWEQKHALRPFYETLRDRLISYFEMINLTHKPKIVAVTSAGAKAGVTTVATGLAAALSETGEGNVLLVNMNVQEGEAHHFYKGKLMCDLDQVLEKDQRQDALVQENLYVAREGTGSDALRRALPKQFSQMVPKMKASDFDYIIFDMPPVSQISITPRLARFMDMVLMVVESDKTDRDVAKRAAAMLAETKTNVGIILNKTRSYVPKSLQQEL